MPEIKKLKVTMILQIIHGVNKKGGYTMKFQSYLFAPLCCAMIIGGMAGCSDELESGSNDNRPHGNGIVFGASANYAGDPETRTEYGDVSADGNSQEIRWTDGDCVDIYSPTSPNQQQVEYSIDNIGGTDGTDKGTAYLAAIDGQNGLQWSHDATQDFYAVYPSKNSMSNTTIRDRYVKYENGVYTGYVPINQEHAITKSGNTFTATPVMDYLYMVAMNEDFAVPTDGSDGGVKLDFMPLTTTLEITIQGPTTQPLASLNVEANGVPVAGQFQCDLVNGDRDEDGIPVCESLQQGTTNDYVTVSLYYDDNGTRRPLTLDAGESVTFNVFLLPTAALTNVSIRVAGFNAASKTMLLADNGTPITLNPHKKTRVKVSAPSIGSDETNEWITGIQDNVLVSQLSIPGTANSFSYMYSGEDIDWHRTQTATITDQWNAGIRCFELRGPNNASGDDLADAPLQCNRQDLGITFGEAVSQINDLLTRHPGEFAMIIPAFESDAGRFVKDYASDLNNFFRNHNYNYKTYGRNLTVREARNNLMFIARITSEEDAGVTIEEPVQGVFVDQWGSLKDNWARRGYPVNNWARNAVWGSEAQMEYYMINGNRSADFVPTLPDKGNVDFMHDTQRNDGSTGTAYIQDWNRVVQTTENYSLYSHYVWDIYHYVLSYTQYAYWQESFIEKCNDVWNTFELSIDDNRNQQGSTFYINSLDGYFVDSNIRQSYIPYIDGRTDEYHTDNIIGGDASLSYGQGGMAGNIGAFATAINEYFYNKILGYGQENIYGPMNIVILDRVYNDDPSSYLPSVIINNNYRFPLITSDDISGNPGTESANASYASGGNVWR